jgi:hypothetical protein
VFPATLICAAVQDPSSKGMMSRTVNRCCMLCASSLPGWHRWLTVVAVNNAALAGASSLIRAPKLGLSRGSDGSPMPLGGLAFAYTWGPTAYHVNCDGCMLMRQGQVLLPMAGNRSILCKLTSEPLCWRHILVPYAMACAWMPANGHDINEMLHCKAHCHCHNG